MKRLLSLAGLYFLVLTSVAAQQVSVRDEASVDVEKSMFGSGPSNEAKQEAKRKAVDNAWRRYQSQNTSGARSAIFAAHAAELRKMAEELCAFFFYEETYDKDTGKFSVKVRGNCDQKAVDSAVARLSGGAPAGAAPPVGTKLNIAFMFLARRAADSTEFTAKVSKSASSTVTTTGSEQSAEATKGNSSASQDGASVTQSASTETKGTIKRRDTAYSYVVEQSEGVDNAVTNVLTTGGFDVAKYSDVVGECPGVTLDEVVVNFADPKPNQAELVPPDLRRRMIAAAKKCEMALFATGLLDILKSETLPDRTVRVTVALTADVRDIRKIVPTAVAAIAAVQYQALGNDRLEATNTALKMAAERGTREVVDMLRQRGIN